MSGSYFDDDPNAHLDTENVQDMARRQFGFSVAVGFALLAVAAVVAIRAPSVNQSPIAPLAERHHHIVPASAPDVELAQPAQSAPANG